MDGSIASRATRDARRAARGSTRWFVGMLVAYVVLTLAVVLKTPVLDIDTWVRHLRIKGHHENWYPYIHTYVILGQRGPTLLIALPWFLWLAHRRRSVRPLVMLGVSLVVLNVSVAVVKYATGRLTPREFETPADALFQGGTEYPSGHISNCVVLYGLIALLAAPQYRRLLTIIAAFITVTVSLGTIAINTHWVTDCFAGALAGGLVLASLPWTVPPSERWWRGRVAWWRARRTGRGVHQPVTAAPVEVDAEQRPEELAS